MVKKTMTVMIPAYEPAEQLISMAEQLSLSGFKVLIINDGSGEGFAGIFERAGAFACVINHKTNQGKGSALKTGFRYILQNESACGGVITADADGQHSLGDIRRIAAFLELEKGNSIKKVILGSRSFSGYVPLRSKFGNAVTRNVFAAISGKKIKDTQTGLRGFTPAILSELAKIEGERFEYEMNVLLWAVKKRIAYEEIPIQTIYDPKAYSSHFRTVKDSYSIYASIIKFTVSNKGKGDH